MFKHVSATLRQCSGLVVALTCWLTAIGVLGQTPALIPGDLDDDGLVTVLDLVTVIQEARQPRSLAPALALRADVNEDGVVDDRDADLFVAAILGTPIPQTIAPVSFEPAAHAGEVGVTVRPKVVFPKAVDVTTLNSNNFYATQGGRRLAATVRPSDSGSFAWLFFQEPMPNASTIELVVDGDAILTIRGLLLDADGDGVPGGIARSRFSTVSVTPLPGTVLQGRVVDPGPDLIPRTRDDVLLANGYQYLRPIAGVKVFLHGLEDQAVFTDTNGWYRFEAVPVGNVKVVTDGRTATTAHEGFFWPEMVSNARMEPGITNYLMYIRDTNGVITPGPNGFPMPVPVLYLPRVMSNVLQTVSTTNVTVITLASNAAYDLPPEQQQHLTLEVPPGSMIGENGQLLATGTVGISVVPPDLVREMLPPGLLQHTFDISIQAPGIATFSTPVPMTFPNVFNAPIGTKLNFLSFDHTTGKLVVEGTATVIDDGNGETYVRTDPGFGITHPGWHGLTPPGRRMRSDLPIRCCASPPPLDQPPVVPPVNPPVDPPESDKPEDNPRRVFVEPPPPREVNPFPVGGKGGPRGKGPPGKGPKSEFEIELRFQSSFTTSQKENLREAAERWEKVIVGDVPQVRYDGRLVGGILIDVYRKEIDGYDPNNGSVLAQAGYRKQRKKSRLPYFAEAFIDRDDLPHLSSGSLKKVMIHEFGHTLGFTDEMFKEKKLISNASSSSPKFTGKNARREYSDLFGLIVASGSLGPPVPLESGNQGNKSSHWEQDVFKREVMTGQIELGSINPLTRVTAGLMQDIGYKVYYGGADNIFPAFAEVASEGTILSESLLLPDGDEAPELGLQADFGTANSPVEEFQTQVTASTSYTPELGHGWLPNPPGGLIDVDRGQVDPEGNDALIRDCISTRDATFRVDVATNGLYDVRVVAGDPMGEFSDMMVYANGLLRANLSTRTGEIVTNIFRVTVLDQRIDLRFASSSGTAICGVEVHPALEGDFPVSGPSQMSGRFHILIEDLDAGLLMRSAATLNPGQPLCPEGVFLPSNTRFREWAYLIETREIGVSEFVTGASGGESILPAVVFGPQETTAEDSDGDGLSDVAEWIIGSDPGAADSDNDGLSDLLEVQQGQNPIGANATAVTGVVGALPLPGAANELTLWNGGAAGGQILAALALGGGGLGIVDVTRPSNPVQVGQLALPGDALDVAVDPVLGVAVVAAQSGGLHVVDVSDPGAPKLIRTLHMSAPQVEIIAGVAYFSVGSQLWTLDLASLELLQQLPLGGAAITGLGCEGQFLYTMDANRTLRVLDLAGGDLQPRGWLNLTHGGGRIFVGGGVAFVAGGGGAAGFITVNVTNPDALLILGGTPLPNIQGAAVAANGSGLAVSVGTVIAPAPSLDVLDVSNLANTGNIRGSYRLPGSPRAVTLAGGIAYVACGEAGLRVVNYSSPDFQRMAPTLALQTDFSRTSLTNGHVEGGQLTRAVAQVTDDVQVRGVEFYVDGALAINDLTFPFEYRFLAPSLSPLKTNFTLRARALDTGGNATWSEEILVDLDPDFTGPLVRRVTPVPNAIVGTTDRVTAWFNEPLDPASLTTNTFQLFAYGTNGPVAPPFAVAVTNVSLFYRADVNAAFLIASSNLAAGLYEARLLPPLADRSSNVLAAPVSWFFQVLDRADRDLDGVPDDVEATLDTDPDSPDSDGDALLDGVEDSDNDGLSNRWEIAAGLAPTRDDTDGNGVKDGAEDPDQDSLSNLREQLAGTLPLNPDTDGDGWNDEAEITGRSLPLNAASTPRLYVVSEPPAALAIPVIPEVNPATALSFGSVVANPPVSLAIPVIPEVNPTTALSFGSVLANPPAALAIPVIPLDAQRVPLTFGSVVANPPAALAVPVVPLTDPTTALSFGSVLANPPAALAVPVATVPGLLHFTNFGSVIAVPPVLIIQTNTP